MGEIQPRGFPATDELLRTKLAPPHLPSPPVPRPALLARLEEGRDRKLTLISAPAGFGKTTLAAEWVRKLGNWETGKLGTGNVAWLSLDPGDNDPVRFWRYAISACRAFDPELGKPALAMLRAAQPPSFEAVLTAFLNQLADLPGRYTLVLEDYHAITAPPIHEALAFLLDHLPASLHLVLIARSEPPLPLARLRARDQLSQFGAADLRFSHQETQAFLERVVRAPLSPEAVTRLEALTEGWPAGLRLVALALESRPEPEEVDGFLASFGGGHRHVLEYLAGEVLAAQPEAWQEFLLKTSFLKRLTGSLCDAVMGDWEIGKSVDWETGKLETGKPTPQSTNLPIYQSTDFPTSQSILEHLERSNLFIFPLDDRREWYRYHTLFADAMRHYARQRLGQAAVRGLHEKASAWYEAHGLLDEAVETALEAQQFAHAAILIERLVEIQGFNELHTVRRWCEQLPEDVLHAHPTLCFDYAIALLFTSDRHSPATAALLEAPLRTAEEAWRLEHNYPKLGQVLSMRGMMAAWQGDLTRAFAYSGQALELLSEHDAFWRGVSLLILGMEELLAGKVSSARRVIIESRALYEAARNAYGASAAALMLGNTYVEQGEFDQALHYYEQVLAEASGVEDMLDDQGLALLGLSAIAYERDDLETAERRASRALEFGQRRLDEDLQVHASLILARVEQARGHVAQAQQRLQSLAARVRRPLLLREVQAWQARLWLTMNDISSVPRWSTAVAAHAEEIPLMQQEREALIIARLRLAEGEAGAALELLEGWQADAQAQGRTRSEIEILCVQALAYRAQGDQSQAEQRLVRALALARPGGLRRVFLDEGEAVARLIAAAAPRLDRRPLAAYAAGLLRDLAPIPAAAGRLNASPLLEPLSPQERRVLRLLAAGLSNPEIAEELIVSINTVKTQVQSIYRKLDVHSREEAAEAARELNLL
jgi:LuxR family maltose regulon positive regulatory protein